MRPKITWWTFRPRKKIFGPPPQIPRRHPPGPLHPPLFGRPPPPPEYSIKNRTPHPSLPLQTPPSPPPEQKKIENIRNVHQEPDFNRIFTFSTVSVYALYLGFSRILTEFNWTLTGFDGIRLNLVKNCLTPSSWVGGRVSGLVRADFWEGDEDSNFSVFRVRRFTEWPGPLCWIAFPVESLPKPSFTELHPPFSLKDPFFHWKVLRRIPFPKVCSDMLCFVKFYWYRSSRHDYRINLLRARSLPL